MTWFAAALRLLQVNSNKPGGGGSAEWTRHKEELSRALSELPASEQRSLAEHLMTTMSKCAVMKTKGSWCPFIFCIIEHLSPEKLKEACEITKMREEAVRIAMANAQAQASNNSSKKRALTLLPKNSKDNSAAESNAEAGRSKKKKGANSKASPESTLDPPSQASEATPPSQASEATLPSQAATATPDVPSSSGKAQSGIQRFMVVSTRQPCASKADVAQPEATQQDAEIQPAVSSSANTSSDEAVHGDGAEEAQQSNHAPEVARYYAVLGVDLNAGPVQIRQAYRQKVLQTHPDKGGSAEAFRQVVEAFESLTDPSKRAANTSTSQADCTDEVDQRQLAKNVCAQMLMLPPESWSSYLKTVDLAVREALATELQTSAKSKDEVPSESTDFSGKGTGLKHNKSGWWVQVSWRNFKITAQTSIKSMEQAVNSHIALTTIRAVAVERWEKHLANLASVGVDQKDIGAEALDSCPVLTASEHRQLLQLEPFVPFLFSSDFPTPKLKSGSKNSPPRIQTNWTSNLDTALEFRSLSRAAQGHDGKIEQLKSSMATRAASERAESKKRMELAAKVVKESISASRSSLPAPVPTPALQETAAAELVQNMQALQDGFQSLSTQVSALQARENSLEAEWQEKVRQIQEQHESERSEQKEQHEQLLLEETRRHEEALLQQRQMHEVMQLQKEAADARQQKQISEEVLAKVLDAFKQPQPRSRPAENIIRATWIRPDTDTASSSATDLRRILQPVSPLEPPGSYGHRNPFR